MAHNALKGERSVAQSHQIQAFRIIHFYHSHSAYRCRIGSYADANGAGNFPALYLRRCISYFRSLTLYYGCRDVNANDWF